MLSCRTLFLFGPLCVIPSLQIWLPHIKTSSGDDHSSYLMLNLFLFVGFVLLPSFLILLELFDELFIDPFHIFDPFILILLGFLLIFTWLNSFVWVEGTDFHLSFLFGRVVMAFNMRAALYCSLLYFAVLSGFGSCPFGNISSIMMNHSNLVMFQWHRNQTRIAFSLFTLSFFPFWIEKWQYVYGLKQRLRFGGYKVVDLKELIY